MKRIDNIWTYNFLLEKIEEIEAQYLGKKMPEAVAEDLSDTRRRVSEYEKRVGMWKEDYRVL